jgi:hypothetical protein
MNNRPVASLTPTLLARKGAARPAMRPQIQPLRALQDNASRQLDDLGWNDMGGDAPEPAAVPLSPLPVLPNPEIPTFAAEPEIVELPAAAKVVALTPLAEPASTPEPVAAPEAVIVPLLAKIPEIVRQQQDEIAARIAPQRRSALAEGRRAAFTLRLDAERHLKLRLASVTSNRSAQQLVTEALDRLIAELPDVADLAAELRKRR